MSAFHVFRGLGFRERALAVLLLGLLAASPRAASAAEYPVTGLIVSVNPASRTFVASIQAIPNYMQAMTMPFEVRQAADLRELAPGVVVTFTPAAECSIRRTTCSSRMSRPVASPFTMRS